MNDWVPVLLRAVTDNLADDSYWRRRLAELAGGCLSAHLAVFREPLLRFVLDGQKQAESRFSETRRAPYACVRRGDAILLKRVAGPVLAIAEVSQVWYYELDVATWRMIRMKFGPKLKIEDPGFWHRKASACYATLMLLTRVTPVSPVKCGKKDRRGWVVLKAAR